MTCGPAGQTCCHVTASGSVSGIAVSFNSDINPSGFIQMWVVGSKLRSVQSLDRDLIVWTLEFI